MDDKGQLSCLPPLARCASSARSTYIPLGDASGLAHWETVNCSGMASWRYNIVAKQKGSKDGNPHCPGQTYRTSFLEGVSCDIDEVLQSFKL